MYANYQTLKSTNTITKKITLLPLLKIWTVFLMVTGGVVLNAAELDVSINFEVVHPSWQNQYSLEPYETDVNLEKGILGLPAPLRIMFDEPGDPGFWLGPIISISASNGHPITNLTVTSNYFSNAEIDCFNFIDWSCDTSSFNIPDQGHNTIDFTITGTVDGEALETIATMNILLYKEMTEEDDGEENIVDPQPLEITATLDGFDDLSDSGAIINPDEIPLGMYSILEGYHSNSYLHGDTASVKVVVKNTSDNALQNISVETFFSNQRRVVDLTQFDLVSPPDALEKNHKDLYTVTLDCGGGSDVIANLPAQGEVECSANATIKSLLDKHIFGTDDSFGYKMVAFAHNADVGTTDRVGYLATTVVPDENLKIETLVNGTPVDNNDTLSFPIGEDINVSYRVTNLLDRTYDRYGDAGDSDQDHGKYNLLNHLLIDRNLSTPEERVYMECIIANKTPPQPWETPLLEPQEIAICTPASPTLTVAEEVKEYKNIVNYKSLDTCSGRCDMDNYQLLKFSYVGLAPVGNLSISKTVTGGTDSQSFALQLDCSDDDFDANFTLAHGATHTVNDIPQNTTCTVSETAPTAPSGYSYDTPVITPAVTIGDGMTTVAVTNPLIQNKGSISISKKVTGGTDSQSFALQLDCSDDNFDESFTLAHGATHTVSDIPQNTTCTVSETTPTAPSGYSYGTPVIQPTTAVTIGDDTTATVVVTNPLTPLAGLVSILKTVYGDDVLAIAHDNGAGCGTARASSLAVIVDADKDKKVPVTYCFEVTNTGDTYLTDIDVTDATLGIQHAALTLLNGPEPAGLEPGASLLYYYEVTLENSLKNTASVKATPSTPDGTPTGADPVTSTNPSTADVVLILDPPSALKTVTPSGDAGMEWKMVWINDSIIDVQNVVITDEVPEGTHFDVATGVTCDARGTSATVSCVFEDSTQYPPRGRIVWKGMVAADPGLKTEDTANNEVVIRFVTVLDNPATPNQEITNQASSEWDYDNDPNTPPVTAITDNPVTPDGDDPTLFQSQNNQINPNAIPTLSEWALLMLMMMLGFVGYKQGLDRKKYF